MAYPKIHERTRYPITCERCGRTVVKLKKYDRFCSRHCSSNARGLNDRTRYNISDDRLFEALVSANGIFNKRTDKLNHVLKELGVSYQSLCLYMRRIGYKWSPASRRRPAPAVLAAFRGQSCTICGDSRSIELCHAVAASDGGPAIVGNLVPLCPSHHVYYDRGLLTQQESEDLEYEFAKMWGLV